MAILILLHIQRVKIKIIKATTPIIIPIVFYLVKLDFSSSVSAVPLNPASKKIAAAIIMTTLIAIIKSQIMQPPQYLINNKNKNLK